MDPDANLKKQLELAQDILKVADEGTANERKALDVDAAVICAERLAELVIALDVWLRNGGFLPEQWRTRI